MAEAVYRDFGRVVADRRKRIGLSQELLAARVGLSRTSIVNIEQGRQRVAVHLLLALAEALETQPASLLPTDAGPRKTDADRVSAKQEWIERVAPEATRPRR